MKSLLVLSQKSSKHLRVSTKSAPSSSTGGGFVTLDNGKGTRIFGKVCGYGAGTVKVKLAVPDSSGVLIVTDCETEVSSSNVVSINEPVHREAKMKAGTFLAPFVDKDTKAATVIEDEDTKMPVDYLDVVIEGFASTFARTTPRDRDGDAVADTAFNETLGDFMANPVMLIDHFNSVRNIAGSFSKLNVTKTGLAVQAKLSNAPGLRDVRFLIMEKHLRAFSMGGLFLYGGSDGRTIEKVYLFEISLVAIPANQDALFQVRSISSEDVERITKQFKSRQPGVMSKLLGAEL